MGTKALLTAEQYAELEEPQGMRYELSEGELIASPSAMFFHNLICKRVLLQLGAFVDQKELGEVVLETDFQLGEDTVRRPDIAFVSSAKLATIDPHKRLQIAPDLAIEVASLSDRPDDLMLKVQQYLSSGTSTVLVIYPEARLAYLYRGQGHAEVFESGVVEILPGFALHLEQILAE